MLLNAAGSGLAAELVWLSRFDRLFASPGLCAAPVPVSALPINFQFRSDTANGEALLASRAPFINQMAFAPLDVFLQRISALPLPSKSPSRMICHVRSVTDGGEALLVSRAPFINQ